MRRTKEDAGKTRAAIVDAALTCFDRHGIAGSTLEQIATAANVSKGAIYHHFAGKREILHEIREQVTIPLMDEADTALLESGEVPALERVERFLLSILESLRDDARMRTALSVMQFKCEYVDDLAAELDGAVQKNERLLKAFEAAYRDAARKGLLAKPLAPEIAALETLMFLSGLVRLWLVHGPRSRLHKQAADAVRAHVTSRRAAPSR
jgi:TetR/AcrR family transcriptional regulator, acrAB operon repressor